MQVTFRSRESSKQSFTLLTGCRLYTVSDNRSFFEREYPQSSLPRRLSNSSCEDVLRQLRSMRLIALSCARDVEGNIDRFRSHIEPIVDLFHPSSRILILESDPEDHTVEKLRQWSRAQLYTYGRLSNTYLDRTQCLAFCRNTLLDYAHNLTADYILVIDFDIFSATVLSFLSNFQYDTNDWAVMTSSSQGPYYDIWALRTLSDSVMKYDVWHRIWDLQLSIFYYCYQSLKNQIVGIHEKHIPVERG